MNSDRSFACKERFAFLALLLRSPYNKGYGPRLINADLSYELRKVSPGLVCRARSKHGGHETVSKACFEVQGISGQVAGMEGPDGSLL